MGRRMSPRRRLRLLRSGLVLVVVVVAIVRFASGGSHPASAHSDGPRPRPANAAPRSEPTRTAVTMAPFTGDPFTTTALRRYLTSHARDVSVGIYDARSGKTWTFNPSARDTVASIMKVDIMATLLADHQSSGSLDSATVATATGMIENSDNGDAQQLWDRVGAAAGVARFNASVGMSQTTLNTEGYWGLSRTSAADQVDLLRHIAYPNQTLTTASRRTETALMTHVERSQAWGITAGLPKVTTVAVKNGWLPLATGWQVNSDGFVKGGGYDDVVSVLTRHSPSEAAGIAMIEHIAGLLWTVYEPATEAN